jgi:regulatory protein
MNEALQHALVLLQRRDHSAHELTVKLKRLGHDVQTIQQALDHCQHYDHQNDGRFAEQWCRMRIQKGYGPLKIIYELKQHHLSEQVMQQVTDDLQIDWCEQARQVLNKQAWRFKSARDAGKASRYLLARGFSTEVIRLCIKERSEYENR